MIKNERIQNGYIYAEVTRAKSILPRSRNGRREVVWVAGREGKKFSAFIVCPKCESINDITALALSGAIHPHAHTPHLYDCVVCSKCSTHSFLRLLGWGTLKIPDVTFCFENMIHNITLYQLNRVARKHGFPDGILLGLDEDRLTVHPAGVFGFGMTSTRWQPRGEKQVKELHAIYKFMERQVKEGTFQKKYPRLPRKKLVKEAQWTNDSS